MYLISPDPRIAIEIKEINNKKCFNETPTENSSH